MPTKGVCYFCGAKTYVMHRALTMLGIPTKILEAVAR